MNSEVTRVEVNVKKALSLALIDMFSWHEYRTLRQKGVIPTPAFYHFSHIHSSRQGVVERAEYFLEYPEETLAYLVFFSAMTIHRKRKVNGIFEHLKFQLGYDPTDGQWQYMENHVLSELSVRNY